MSPKQKRCNTIIVLVAPKRVLLIHRLYYRSLWMPLQLRTAAGRKMVAWKMSTVIVAGKGINRARSTNHDRTEITNSNQPYFWGGVFSTHEIWEEKIWERLFWSTLIFIRVEKFFAGWTNKGNKVTIHTSQDYRCGSTLIGQHID